MKNKLLGTTINPSLSDKLGARDRIHSNEKDKIVKS